MKLEWFVADFYRESIDLFSLAFALFRPDLFLQAPNSSFPLSLSARFAIPISALNDLDGGSPSGEINLLCRVT